MKTIVVYNKNKLEQKMIKSVIEEALDSCYIMVFDNIGQTLSTVKTIDTALIIADIPNNNIDSLKDLKSLKDSSKKSSLIVTTLELEENISPFLWKLHPDIFVLKPFRPSRLIEAIRELIDDEEREINEPIFNVRRGLIQKTGEAISKHRYKDVIENSMEYLDFLHGRNISLERLRIEAVEFATDMISLVEFSANGVNTTTDKSIKKILSDTPTSVWNNKYRTFLVYESIINLIFNYLDVADITSVTDKQKIFNHIDRNIRMSLSLDEVADFAHMSPCYFSKYFKKISGENFVTYTTNRKMELAKLMLTDSELPVINIAYELSYGESNYFSKIFKRKVGATPTQYRTDYSLKKRIV